MRLIIPSILFAFLTASLRCFSHCRSSLITRLAFYYIPYAQICISFANIIYHLYDMLTSWLRLFTCTSSCCAVTYFVGTAVPPSMKISCPPVHQLWHISGIGLTMSDSDLWPLAFGSKMHCQLLVLHGIFDWIWTRYDFDSWVTIAGRWTGLQTDRWRGALQNIKGSMSAIYCLERLSYMTCVVVHWTLIAHWNQLLHPSWLRLLQRFPPRCIII